MRVDGDRLRRARAEQAQIFRVQRHGLGRAVAADMAVHADHRVGLGHHHMQVMRDEENAAAGALADSADEIIERNLARKIDALHWLVQHEQLGFSHQRPRDQRPLKLAAGKVLHFGFRQMRNSGIVERGFDGRGALMPGQRHQPLHRQRHGPVH